MSYRGLLNFIMQVGERVKWRIVSSGKEVLLYQGIRVSEIVCFQFSWEKYGGIREGCNEKYKFYVRWN